MITLCVSRKGIFQTDISVLISPREQGSLESGR